MKKEPKIYSQEYIYRQGWSKIFGRLFQSAWQSREITYQFFLRDFKARYKQSLFGWIWIFLMPLVTMGTFLLLNISGVIKIGHLPVPYPIYGLLGFSLWQIFANGWLLLTASITSAGVLINQINFPREALLFSFAAQVIVDFLIRMGLVLLVYLLYGLRPSWLTLLFPLFVMPVILLTIGLSFFSSLFNVIIRDVKDILAVILNFFLFLMPIMYTIPEKGFLAIFNRVNPLYFLVAVPRDLIIFGKITHPWEFFLSSLLSVFIFFSGWVVFYLAQNKIAERM